MNKLLFSTICFLLYTSAFSQTKVSGADKYYIEIPSEYQVKERTEEFASFNKANGLAVGSFSFDTVGVLFSSLQDYHLMWFSQFYPNVGDKPIILKDETTRINNFSAEVREYTTEAKEIFGYFVSIESGGYFHMLRLICAYKERELLKKEFKKIYLSFNQSK